MGIQGSAVATLIANAVSFFALLGWLRLRRHPLWIGRRQLGLFKPDLTIVRTLVVKGLPMGVQIVMISLAMIAMISMVNEHGVQTASAYSAALQLWTYVQMPAMAIGAACSSMAAQNVGRGPLEACQRHGQCRHAGQSCADRQPDRPHRAAGPSCAGLVSARRQPLAGGGPPPTTSP
jgi:Na+-driven multidrug efflux pump